MTGLAIIAFASAAPMLAGAAADSKQRSDALRQVLVAPDRRAHARSVDLIKVLPYASPLVAVPGWLIGGPPVALTVAVSALIVPSWIRRGQRAKLAHLADRQLIDAVRALAAGLRSGMSLQQAIGHTAGGWIDDVLEPVLARFCVCRRPVIAAIRKIH